MRLRPPVIFLAAACLAAPASAYGATPNILEARAAAADSMMESINRARAREGLHKLRPMRPLERSARGHANRLMSTDSFYHRSPLPTPGGIVRTGEVIAIHSGRNNAVRPTVRSWMRSGSHRSILLDGAMNRIGAGISKGIFQGYSQSIWVVQVGRR